MNIKSLNQVKFDQTKQLYNLFVPQLAQRTDLYLGSYTVLKEEEMRIDLVMLSIYEENPTYLEHIDVILHINGIDNPVNIFEGMEILYPNYDELDSFRVFISDNSSDGEDIRKQLSTVNKTTRTDSNRSNYIENGYSLPPVVLDKSQPPVRLKDGVILIGGLN